MSEIKVAQDLINKLVDSYTSAGMTQVSTDFNPQSLAEVLSQGHGVAEILREWDLSESLQAAALLRALVGDKHLTLQQVEDACGQTVARFCQQYELLCISSSLDHSLHSTTHARKLARLFVAAYLDPLLAILGAAELWYRINPPLINSTPPNNFITEAQEVLFPLLGMLGMWKLRRQLNEILLSLSKGRHYIQHLQHKLDQAEELRQQALSLVYERLKTEGFDIISLKPRSVADIFVFGGTDRPNPELIEALAIDVLVKTHEECYKALERIHRLWRPLEGVLNDTLALGKINGYRCLRTTVLLLVGNKKVRVDFHIRTEIMDQVNQWGVVACFRNQPVKDYIHEAWWTHRQESYQFIGSAPLGSMPDNLWVFSPQGQLFSFDRGCTVVDYGYQVHSELTNQCGRFIVNGLTVSPTTPLHHLDIVEIERDTNASGPTQIWLSAAQTTRAQYHIKRFLRRQRKVSFEGQQVLNQRLSDLESHYGFHIPDFHVDQALRSTSRNLKLPHLEDLLSQIAKGRLSPDKILHPLFAREIVRQIQLPDTLRLRPHQIHLAQCCRPRPGDTIIGVVRHRKDRVTGLTIHKKECLWATEEIATQTEIKWRLKPMNKTVLRVEFQSIDEPGLLGDVLQPVYERTSHLILHEVNASVHHGIAHIAFLIEADQSETIEQIVSELQNLNNHEIDNIKQLRPLLSELETLGALSAEHRFNPYSRQPIEKREMFVGRSEEVRQVETAINTNGAIFFIQGQRRVGKTSFLLHFHQKYQKDARYISIYIDFQLLGRLSALNLFFSVADILYNELKMQKRLGHFDSPLREVFEQNPAVALIAYLKTLKKQLGNLHLLLLLDEFSKLIDACDHGELDTSVLEQWRGVLQAVGQDIHFLIALQQRTFDNVREASEKSQNATLRRLLEMGEPVALKPLKEVEAKWLIEGPTRNFMEYSPDALKYVLTLVGGNPFLIQAFCQKLVTRMTNLDRRSIFRSDVDDVCNDFMTPEENTFEHLLEYFRGLSDLACRHLAHLVQLSNSPVDFSVIHACLSDVPGVQLRRTLERLSEYNILTSVTDDCWVFNSLLFGRWVAKHLPPNDLYL